jgi:hypothetical protein
MKKILKFKGIKKNKHTKYAKKATRKKKHCKKDFIFKKNFYQIASPHNTNDYLINNNSAPFFNYFDDDEESYNEMSLPIQPIYFNKDNNSELDLFTMKEIDSTNEKTSILIDKSYLDAKNI